MQSIVIDSGYSRIEEINEEKNILCRPDALGCKERVALVLDDGGAREGVLGAVG